MIRDAVISECGCYRYELLRVWDPTLPLVEFDMLNPSTADAFKDDPTIRRCIGLGERWGFGGLVVHNLYAWRATDPTELANVDDPIGPKNRMYLEGSGICKAYGIVPWRIVAAWGAHAAAVRWWNTAPHEITSAVRSRRMFCLGTTKSGAPKHPLYVRNDAVLKVWTP